MEEERDRHVQGGMTDESTEEVSDVKEGKGRSKKMGRCVFMWEDNARQMWFMMLCPARVKTDRRR